jgi:hypothetical protein
MSRLSKVLSNFGFGEKHVAGKVYDACQVQIAFLENLYFAGYFKDKKIWQVFSSMDEGFESHGRWKKGRYATLKYFRRITNKCGANQDNPDFFRADFLLDHAFADKNFFDEKDIEDVVVQLGQSAFGRTKNQERSEINNHDWMAAYHDKYLRNAEILGLVLEKKPLFKTYDETWLQGSARPSAEKRVQYLKKLKKLGIKTGAIRVMTGARELWAEIDNIDGDLDEAKSFMLELAKENKIDFNEKEKFVIKNVGESDRTFLNSYQMLTETMMMKKLYREIIGENPDEIINSHPHEGESRPTTAIVARDVARGKFGEKFKKGEFKKNQQIKIMIISNQPFCYRQALTIENVVISEIAHHHEIIFDSVGSESYDEINLIHSEFGALINEGFKHSHV